MQIQSLKGKNIKCLFIGQWKMTKNCSRKSVLSFQNFFKYSCSKVTWYPNFCKQIFFFFNESFVFFHTLTNITF